MTAASPPACQPARSMSNAREKKRAKKMRNQPANVTLGPPAGEPRPSPAQHCNGGSRPLQPQQQGKAGSSPSWQDRCCPRLIATLRVGSHCAMVLALHAGHITKLIVACQATPPHSPCSLAGLGLCRIQAHVLVQHPPS